jgi:hypothetical protein
MLLKLSSQSLIFVCIDDEGLQGLILGCTCHKVTSSEDEGRCGRE